MAAHMISPKNITASGFAGIIPESQKHEIDQTAATFHQIKISTYSEFCREAALNNSFKASLR